MGNQYFEFKQFLIHQEKTAMKVGVDSVLLGSWVQPDLYATVLDIGAGTGILSLMMCQRFNAQIDAVEIDGPAHEQAKENCAASQWNKQITIHHSSIQDFVRANNRQYELVISNPPYFSNSLKSGDNSRNTARHTDGLSPNDLLSSVVRCLANDGMFALILPLQEANSFQFKASIFGLFCKRKLNVKPKATKGVNRVIMEFIRQKSVCIEEEICIYDGAAYSMDYKRLTKDFYLKL